MTVGIVNDLHMYICVEKPGNEVFDGRNEIYFQGVAVTLGNSTDLLGEPLEGGLESGCLTCAQGLEGDKWVA